jgi:DNA polymerase IV
MFLPARTIFETSWANGRMATTATILHADLDAFYASVEQLLDPSLRGRPIAVGGGVVLAASYEAKAFGVRGGMAGRQAYELCPQIIFVSGHFKEYQRLGDAAIKMIGDFTPLVERISIDEAFADVAGCTHLFGPPVEIAKAIRQRVRAELSLPISVGVARTKHLAKIASQVAKPDGLLIIDPETELEFLHRLPVELMWGVGPVTKARLAEIGVLTIGQLAKSPGWSLERLLGPAAGEKLAALAWNRDRREIKVRRRARSAGAQSAIGRKPADEQVFRPTLLHLADRIGSRLRAKSRLGRTVTVRVRFANLKSVTRSVTLGAPISATIILAEIAEDLVRAALVEHPDEKTISLLAISVSHLEEHWDLELELPLGLQDERRCPGTKIGMARWAADRAVDKIRDRFGWDAIGYGSVTLGTPRSVPDEFRELAEKDL